MNHSYIAKQIDFVNELTKQQRDPAIIEDTLWRIASNADFPSLDPSGKLTDEQKAAVYTFIGKFEKSPSGKAAIEEFNQFNYRGN